MRTWSAILIILSVAAIASGSDDPKAIATALEDELTIDDAFDRAYSVLASVKGINDPDWRIVFTQCEAIAKHRQGSSTVRAALLAAQLCKSFPEYTDRTVKILAGALKGTSGADRCELIACLGRLPSKSSAAVEILRPELSENRALGVFYSIHAAASIAMVTPDAPVCDEMIMRLRRGLNDERAFVRWMSVDGLGLSGVRAKSAVASIRVLLMDENRSVRAAAARAVWRVTESEEESVAVLLGVLRDLDEAYYNRPVAASGYVESSHLVAIRTFSEIGIANIAIVDALSEELHSSQIDCCRAAAAALAELPLRGHVSDSARRRIVRATMAEDLVLRSRAQAVSQRTE